MGSPLLSSQAPRHKTVVIADDSVVVRGLFARWLGEVGNVQVVAVAGDGETALAHAGRFKPDAMVLDLDMPGIDSAEALTQILRESPQTSILLAATLNERNTRLALECLTKGAVDLVSKPDSRSGMTLSLDFRSEFLLKFGGLARLPGRHAPLAGELMFDAPPTSRSGLTHLVSVMPRYLVIGASTGGPRAVAKVLHDIGDALGDVTTLVVQHMPPLFTASFAEQIAHQIGLPTREPYDGERLNRGTVYIAPGGRHLGVDRRLGHIVATVTDGPPVNFCRPAVDVLFTDAARHLGAAAMGLVLTGMGSDGTDGAVALRRAGAAVIAQDEASSTIWGMPGSVVRALQASTVLGLDEIGLSIRSLLRGSAA